MDNKGVPFTWIDWSLSAAIAVLSVVLLSLLCEPALREWANRPRPGMQVAQHYLPEQGSGTDGTAPVNYLLYLPPEYDANRKWPLVVFLHGAGERGEDLEKLRRAGLPGMVQRDLARDWGFVLLSPQCPKDSYWNPEQITALVEHVSSRLAVDRDRVYLTGYSMGGFGTWATASYKPDRFAAIAPLCGGGDPASAERLKNLPTWAFHGDKDQVVPFEASKTMVDAVKKCGGNIRFTAYPGAGHGICDTTYRDSRFYDWLLSQRRNHVQGKESVRCGL
jgi:predicted peptidase